MKETTPFSGSTVNSGMTMLQKLLLASLLASSLTAMNTAYADSARLIAEAVLVEKNPVVVAVPDIGPDGEPVVDAPPLIGSAVNASYVSEGGWAVTGADFIDAAVQVFDFNATESVTQATLSLLNRYQFSRHLAASVDNALHTLQATADYWNCAVVCCYKTFQCNQKYHS